jgi:hypothetical protein
MNHFWNIAYAAGILAIVASCLAGAVALVIIGRATRCLRSSVGSRYSYRALLSVGARVIVSRRAFLSTASSADAAHFEIFRLRMRRALSLLAVPFAISLLLRVYLSLAS